MSIRAVQRQFVVAFSLNNLDGEGQQEQRRGNLLHSVRKVANPFPQTPNICEELAHRRQDFGQLNLK
jgi:hypothetical protein